MRRDGCAAPRRAPPCGVSRRCGADGLRCSGARGAGRGPHGAWGFVAGTARRRRRRRRKRRRCARRRRARARRARGGGCRCSASAARARLPTRTRAAPRQRPRCALSRTRGSASAGGARWFVHARRACLRRSARRARARARTARLFTLRGCTTCGRRGACSGHGRRVLDDLDLTHQQLLDSLLRGTRAHACVSGRVGVGRVCGAWKRCAWLK
jgi:hypothetical protein